MCFPRFFGSLKARSQWWFVLKRMCIFQSLQHVFAKSCSVYFQKPELYYPELSHTCPLQTRRRPSWDANAVDIEIATKNFFLFQVCQLYFFWATGSVNSALVLHAEILGHKWGKSSLGGNVKVNDCWRKRGKVVCDQAATVSPGASQVSGSKRLKHTFGQLQRLTPATNRPSTESGSLSIWTDRPDKRSSGCAIAAISDDFAGTSNPSARLIRNLKRDNWLIRGVIRLFPPNATTPNLDGNVPGI